MAMTPEAFAQRLARDGGENIRSVILYGSAVAGDHVRGQSDYNILIIAQRLAPDELRALSSAIQAWVRAGNPPPLLMTADQFVASADAFALEWADIRDAHQVLVGEDLIAGVQVSRANLRTELEYQLKGKLRQLRAAYALAGRDAGRIRGVMTRSVSTFLVLFRGALRLYQSTVPMQKLDALAALSKHVPINVTVFETIMQLKAGRKLPGVVPERLFGDYLAAIDGLTAAIDSRLRHAGPTQEME